MNRHIAGLANSAASDEQVPPGLYLVRVNRIAYRWHKQKPFYNVLLRVIEPSEYANSSIASRLYCTPKALWKLAWFLRDFGYDQGLLSDEQIDDQAAIGLEGVVKLTHTIAKGRCSQNLDAFAPAADWNRLQSSDDLLAHPKQVAG